MARHIRGNTELADIDDIITPGKKRPGLDKDSAIRTLSHNNRSQQRKMVASMIALVIKVNYYT